MTFILVCLLFLLICKVKNDLQEEMKKYITREELEDWLNKDFNKE